MRVLMFGSRSLTWKHLPVFRALAPHACIDGPLPLGAFLQEPEFAAGMCETVSDTITLLNGDGSPGKERGAVGADKLALLACMEAWPMERRRVRWFKPEDDPEYKAGTVTWGQAAARRDVAMADARPERAYCVHTDLDASKGSIITARALTERGIRFWYVRVTMAGDVVSVEER
jgi:hypothetical protein